MSVTPFGEPLHLLPEPDFTDWDEQYQWEADQADMRNDEDWLREQHEQELQQWAAMEDE